MIAGRRLGVFTAEPCIPVTYIRIPRMLMKEVPQSCVGRLQGGIEVFEIFAKDSGLFSFISLVLEY
jgi:hypothetical protein